MIDPHKMLMDSYTQALAVGDVYSQYFCMTTLDELGFPVSRTVTLREITSEGIIVYINRESPKVEQLKQNPAYELLFFWPSILRQFRLRGSYEIFENEQQHRSWESKSYAGKLYDLFHAYGVKQSSKLPSRDAYIDKAMELRTKFPNNSDLEMPPEVVCIRFIPDYIESWYGSMQNHLHDRRLFRRRDDDTWLEVVLIP